jgi:hypothetical protein
VLIVAAAVLMLTRPWPVRSAQSSDPTATRDRTAASPDLTSTPAAGADRAEAVVMGEPEEIDDDVVVPILLRSVPEIDLADDGTVLRIAAHIDAQAPPGGVEIVAESHRITVDVDGRGRATIPLTELAAPEAIADGEIDMTLHFPATPGSVSVGVTLATADTSVGHSRAFDIEDERESLLSRLEADYEAGVLTADEAAVYALRSAIEPDYYHAPGYDEYYADGDDGRSDPEGVGHPEGEAQELALFALTLYEKVTPETRAELDRLLAGDPPRAEPTTD